MESKHASRPVKECPAVKLFWQKLRSLFELVTFSHSVFALTFTLSSFIISHKFNNLDYNLKEILYILIAMVSARNTAMAFNRMLDRDIDALNPRTKDRHLPKKTISLKLVIVFILINSFIFVLISSFFNNLTFILSPVALFIICFYSFTKRFTKWSHFVLGFSLAIAPIAAWIAVTGHFHPLPFFLAVGVLFWVAGFDILYSLQDLDFDQRHGLYSIPAHFGVPHALLFSRLSHGLAFISWFLLWSVYHFGTLYLLALGMVAGLLIWEHSLVSATTLKRLNRAFFTANGYIGIVLFFGILADLCWSF